MSARNRLAPLQHFQMKPDVAEFLAKSLSEIARNLSTLDSGLNQLYGYCSCRNSSNSILKMVRYPLISIAICILVWNGGSEVEWTEEDVVDLQLRLRHEEFLAGK